MICSICRREIEAGQQVAEGPSGTVHYRCFKRRTAHGREVNLMTLSDDVANLTRRVQWLEQRLTDDERDIPFRIGSSS